MLSESTLIHTKDLRLIIPRAPGGIRDLASSLGWSSSLLLLRVVITTRHACLSSLASSHVPNDSDSLYHLCLTPTVKYPATVAVSSVPGDGSRVHTHDHDGSEAPDESHDSILSGEPKPLGKHRSPPPPSILSPGESSYPP
ncbi:hypothetical protein Tco_0295222 [Tanacetum coccineum]